MQFSDFHKFLVSVGGLSLAAAVALPILLLRSQKTVMVTEKQLADLSPNARDAVEAQQKQALWIINYWPPVSIVLFAIGTVLIVVGAVIWKKRQDLLNDRESAELEKVKLEHEKTRHEIRALIRDNKEGEEEAVEAAIKESAADPPSSDQDDRTEVPRPRPPTEKEERPDDGSRASTTRTNISALKTVATNVGSLEIRGMLNYIRAQEEAVLYLERVYAGKLDVVRNVRLGVDRADFMVTSDTEDMPNLAVDVSQINGTSVARPKVRQSLEWAQEARYAARQSFRGRFRPVVFFVIPTNSPPKLSEVVRSEIQRGIHGFSDLSEKPPPMTIILVESEAFETLPLEKSVFAGPDPRVLEWLPSVAAAAESN
ncbi:hypothetical protein [Micromonospora sp. NPDC051006]|uniref:hypothetical protein n=1 Tax=Micromonospora sp. NPDC051006 TaxID=3364283 RepID=UPI0037ABB99B